MPAFASPASDTSTPEEIKNYLSQVAGQSEDLAGVISRARARKVSDKDILKAIEIYRETSSKSGGVNQALKALGVDLDKKDLQNPKAER